MTQEGSQRPVVVGVDGSDAALVAARLALDEARQRSAPLRIVTAVPWPHAGITLRPPRDDLSALLRANGHAVAQRVADDLADASGDVDVAITVIEGHPATVLVELSQDTQLIVLGSRGVGGVAGLLIGSTASRVAAHAGCPVIVLPDDSDVLVRDRRSVVVGVEGRPGEDAVLAFAFDEAAARGTDLVAVHAWQEVVLDTSLRTVSPLLDWAGAVADEERVLAEALGGWQEKAPDLVVREAVVRDRTVRALVTASMTAQLLVVGHRARRAPGSTTHGVLNRLTCPVAVVPVAAGAER